MSIESGENIDICLIGNYDSGNAPLIERFVDSTFSDNEMCSDEYKVKSVKLNKQQYNIRLLDCRVDDLSHSNYGSAHGIIITYNSMVSSFFDEVEELYYRIRDTTHNDVKIMIAATNVDAVPDSPLIKKGEDLATKHNLDFLAVSARTGLNVSELIYNIVFTVNQKQQIPMLLDDYQKNLIKQSSTSYTDYNKFLMFGDSITEYAFNQFPVSKDKVEFSLGAALQNIYVRKLQVIQRGFSGYASRDALPLARSILRTEHDNVPDSQKIKVAYLFFGTNDARKKGISSSNKEHAPLEVFLRNLRQTVDEFKMRNIPVVVITPGLHDAKLWNEVDPQDLVTGDYRDNETQKLFQDAIKNTVTDVPLICLYDLMTEWMETKAENPNDYSELIYDGIHLNGTGYKLLFDALMETIEKNFYNVSPGCLMYRFPYSTTLKQDTFANIR